MLLTNLFSSLTCVSAVFYVFSDWGDKPQRPAESAECSPADEPGQSGPEYHRPVRRCRQWVGNHTEAHWPVGVSFSAVCRAKQNIHVDLEHVFLHMNLSNNRQHSTSNHPPFRSPPSSLMLHLSSSAGSRLSMPRASYCPRPVPPPPQSPIPTPRARSSWSEGSCSDL